jgi:Protocatechuate 3,4-dioxygenase beta subunit
VPYDIGGGLKRPAHFHMMITAQGYQPLVTQLYFSGDPYISKDATSSSPNAKRRILDVQTLQDGTKKVLYDVGLSKKLAIEPAAIDKLTGVYTDEKDNNKKTEFFKRSNVLWMKTEVFGRNFDYIGNNTFQYPGMPPEMNWTLNFEIDALGSIKLTQTSFNDQGEKEVSVAKKKY